MNSSPLDPDLLQVVFNHVVLPPKLPSCEDHDDDLNDALINRLLQASRTLRDLMVGHVSHDWENLRNMIQTFKLLNARGKLDRTSLLAAMQRLERRDFLILHVAAQNAGLLIHRDSDTTGETVVFEAFESSPQSERVLAADTLQMVFPGSAVAIPEPTFRDETFQESLAGKAGSSVIESRDTVDPAMIAQILMTLLEANGARLRSARLRKRVRDDVCWSDGAERPWRRSPLWLVLRVGIQRHLRGRYGAAAGQISYKFLMCTILAHLLTDGTERLGPEPVTILKAKLARRLAKLEVCRQQGSDDRLYHVMFHRLGPLYQKAMEHACSHLASVWDRYKRSTLRPIPPLPHRATGGDLTLSLPNSREYLQHVLSLGAELHRGARPVAPPSRPTDVTLPGAMRTPASVFSGRHHTLADTEAELATSYRNGASSPADDTERCLALAQKIHRYLNSASGVYTSDPEQASVMILTAMRLWHEMDQAALHLFGLLNDYHPGIDAESLDLLHLTHLQDMVDLGDIQTYLAERTRRCDGTSLTIFDDPADGCFATRYFDTSADSPALTALWQQITDAAARAREEKEHEWQTLHDEFNEVERRITESTCVYTTIDDEIVHDMRACTKCYLRRQSKRMRITVHEDPLPADDVAAKALVFELDCPPAFSAYRRATWRILGALSQPLTGRPPPLLLLSEYAPLERFQRGHREGVTLASTAKSHLNTHYRGVSLPVSLCDVCRPSPFSRIAYFDGATRTWTQLPTPVLNVAHHLQIPVDSPFTRLHRPTDPSRDVARPSSYDVIARQTDCPVELNVHEFNAYHSLLSGDERRWLSILIELGASNLNFSAEPVTWLVAKLACQAGPVSAGDPLRQVHRVFRDEHFCSRLMDLVAQRLEGIAVNWRETNCMETLITFMLRVRSLAAGDAVARATTLLDAARQVTLHWISRLRTEVHQSSSVAAAARYSTYLFWAALLCRRTFVPYLWTPETIIDPDALRCFIVCSIALQDNTPSEPDTLPTLARNALVRDLKMTKRLDSLLATSLEALPSSFSAALDVVWPQPADDRSRSLSHLAVHRPWVQCIIDATPHSRPQVVHYHLLDGHLLVDGKPLGRLPADHRESPLLTELFGDQNLWTYPSSLPGMTYRVAFPVHGHRIHVGFRNGTLVVRAQTRHTVLEIIPRHVFCHGTTFDLPGPLVDDCTHWLDLTGGFLEVRQGPQMWRSKRSNWTLDIRSRTATRRTATRRTATRRTATRRTATRRTSALVDPNGRLARQVARIFDGFEDRYHMTVFQPQNRRLTVEIRRLELTFTVNRAGLLRCHELRADIDRNQDAGTWYGLKSMIVLTDSANRSQRSVIVPIGTPRHVARTDIHVTVTIANDGRYARFGLNRIVGRVDCPVEPQLLFSKILYHAYTSYVLPDPLTGRTGTEEALHGLSSGHCQPWTTLQAAPAASLLAIGALTPKREYYPTDLKVMQRTTWNPRLTFTIQHDGFRPAVEGILDKSRVLATFASETSETPRMEPVVPHLLHRALSRRQRYERESTARCVRITDHSYHSRDRCRRTRARSNVFESAVAIRDWSTALQTPSALANTLEHWGTVGGYGRPFEHVLLSDLLDLSLSIEWGALVSFCRRFDRSKRYPMMFLFATLSYRDDIDMDLVRTLIAFATYPDLHALSLPTWPVHVDFQYRCGPDVHSMATLIDPCRVPYEGIPEGFSEASLGPKLLKKKRSHDLQAESDRNTVSRLLVEQWPCQEPTIDGFPDTALVDVDRAMALVRPEWLRLFQNMQLSQSIDETQKVLDVWRTTNDTVLPDWAEEWHPSRVRPERTNWIPSMQQLLSCDTSIDAHTEPRRSHEPESLDSNPGRETSRSGVNPETKELRVIVTRMLDSKSAVQRNYASDLSASIDAFETVQVRTTDEHPPAPVQLSRNLTVEEDGLRRLFNRLCTALETGDERARWLRLGQLWPCVTTVTLLEQLRSTSSTRYGRGVKEALVAYAVHISTVQRLQRMANAERQSNPQQILDECRHRGRTWDPHVRPDWLLLEIDANILLRPDQVAVALATISPASQSNSVLQMNMGQGKTSCIMPMVAAVLANSRNLTRLVVPRALLLQTAQILQSRLGGLVAREIRHVPFSRRTSTHPDTIRTYHELHEQIRTSSGVMISLPEHILSFGLSGSQRLSDGRISEATPMIKTQDWMRKVCRDVLDECDVTLAVRTQLVYPSGSQLSVDGHPHRWEMAETLLNLIEGHLSNLQHDFPQSIEVVRKGHGRFPIVHLLRQDVEDALLGRLADEILLDRVVTPSSLECGPDDRHMIRQFITEPAVMPAVVERMQLLYDDKPMAKQTLFLVRGLFVHRILLLTLKRRWNVHYGLHPRRDPIAVPFHAKGVPSDQAEWGHPDVAILFTCLSFYYAGLNLTQLKQSIQHVTKADDPAGEYDRWTLNATQLPESLRDWKSVNIDDETQLLELWQHLLYAPVIIDYFLNHFVFPQHAKQFKTKLQASGWDIPLFHPEARAVTAHERSGRLRALTTGFSGTNDNKTMLPLNIAQADLDGLKHTNAEVLTYLLQPRNRRYVVAADGQGRHLSESGLLRRLKEMEIRVLIDAGAQILEMDNEMLAKEWLKVDPEAPAVAFFTEENKPFVLYRHGSRLPLIATPYADNLGDCLVYLDEAHTRGTDLKLLPTARGALTLGLGQTKDHTTQAAMRLRQLATTQSLVFVAPPEVNQSILDFRLKRCGDRLDSSDVVAWLLEQTCNGLEQLQPLYFAHGVDFCRRTQAALDHPNFLSDQRHRDAFLTSLHRPEQQTLEQMYKPRAKATQTTALGSCAPDVKRFMKHLNVLRAQFQDSGVAVQATALEEVEQEREVAYEVEAVREVQRPTRRQPLSFPGLHTDIYRFLETGKIALQADGYEHVFVALQRTAVGRKARIRSTATSTRLFVSKEFSRTVELPRGRPNDNFMRPVTWLLWSPPSQAALILIPEEAEEAIGILRMTEDPVTHLLTYAAPVTRKMLHFNHLRFYALPALPPRWLPPTWLTVELGILSGRLYFEYEEYPELMSRLGLVNGAHGNVSPSSDTQIRSHGFTDQPLIFFQEWLSVRRKGQDFTHTPMGHVCRGKPLLPGHPFFVRRQPGASKDSIYSDAKQAKINVNEQATEDNASSNASVDDDQSDADQGQESSSDEGGSKNGLETGDE